MTQPLAFLNDEEMHWLDDLGLPNQRRWLNHRNIGDEHRRTSPPPPRIVAYLATKKHIRYKKRFRLSCNYIYELFVAKEFLRLPEGELAGAALLVLEGRADFEQPIKHFSTLRAARGEL